MPVDSLVGLGAVHTASGGFSVRLEETGSHLVAVFSVDSLALQWLGQVMSHPVAVQLDLTGSELILDIRGQHADARRHPDLSDKERSLLVAYATGLTLASAAGQVGIRPGTAKAYLRRIKIKYQRAGRPAQTKVELAERVREDGLVPRPTQIQRPT
jgi:DNA-binding CsgD family transcriptional regulator